MAQAIFGILYFYRSVNNYKKTVLCVTCDLWLYVGKEISPVGNDIRAFIYTNVHLIVSH